ncbi:MAG: CRISPR-associated protein Cas4 [Geminicoccaceae bacterium]|nr:MAG: CRISPR-associated protein Cas4 [Geminicoccaceae bacterium]
MSGEDRDEGDDFVPLSALAHWVVCPRQCCLIHLEQLWAENLATAEGRLLHERVHELAAERRRGVRVVTGLPVVSYELGVRGIADLVEVHEEDGGVRRYVPVEYKRGGRKPWDAHEVQLCAQAMALEEMTGTEVPLGAVFDGKSRRRIAVRIDAPLRARTRTVAAEVRAALRESRMPLPVYDRRRCDGCSLIDLCKPKVFSGRRSANGFLERCIEDEP